MEINGGLVASDDAKENCVTFGTRYLNLLLSKKRIDEDIKALKQEFTEQGVAVNVVIKAINKLKANKKMTESQTFELDTIYTWMENSKEIDDSIVELNQK